MKKKYTTISQLSALDRTKLFELVFQGFSHFQLIVVLFCLFLCCLFTTRFRAHLKSSLELTLGSPRYIKISPP